MKAKSVSLSILMGALIFISTQAIAQTTDSSQNTAATQKVKEEENKQRLDNAEYLKKDTKLSANQARENAKESKANAKEAKARYKEADRIEDDASDAAKQAKKAVRAETKAQRTRNNADKQARKAAKASEKSNHN